MALQVSVTVQQRDDPQLQAWLTILVAPRADDRIVHDVDIARALMLERPGSSAPPPSHCQILRGEILAAILMAKRRITGGHDIVLQRLGGRIGGEAGISGLPSIAFAVAATLAVMHGTGVEDLERDPHGGHGWVLAAFACQPC